MRYAAAACQTDFPCPTERSEIAQRTARMCQLAEQTIVGYEPFHDVRLLVFPEFAHAAPVYDSLAKLRRAKGQIERLMARYPDSQELQQAGQAALEAITAWDYQIIQPLHETYEDEDAWETMLAGQLRYLLDAIDDTGAPVTQGALDRLADLRSETETLRAEKKRILEEQVAPINRWAEENGIPHVSS